MTSRRRCTVQVDGIEGSSRRPPRTELDRRSVRRRRLTNRAEQNTCQLLRLRHLASQSYCLADPDLLAGLEVLRFSGNRVQLGDG